ncbi:uncharacterized protein METZ01_LOCUS85006 [marine metagenome]|jgi:hypothetical protein|uniref:DUF4149 domain-containing protein n=1 Tax=marine metagenome TaxID=408172 RepID=A0A381UVH8_9ZZZZ
MPHLLVTFVGAFVVGIGLVTIVRPESVKPIARYLSQGRRLYLVMVVQALMAWLLFAIATQTRWPTVMIWLAFLTLISAVILLVMGPKRFRTLTEWAISLPGGMQRGLGFLRLMLGSWLIYAVN